MPVHTRIALCCLFVTGPVAATDAPVTPDAAVTTQQIEQRPAQHRFPIWELQLEGNTLLDRKLIERTLYPHLGPDKTVEDVEAASRALEAFYKDSGYPTVLVDIPEQDVSAGIVRLKVIEGKVARVRVEGSRYFSLGRIRNQVPALAPGQAPNLPELQAQLTALNQATPDRTVTPIFRPGRTPGTVEVELRVKDELPLHADIELNNRYSRDTSKLRAAATLRYANLWQREHSASLMYQTAPENTDDVEVWAGTYVWPLGQGNVLAMYLVDSESNVATAGDISVLGNGTILGARYIKSLAATGTYYHSATFGIDYKDFGESVAPIGAEGTNTPIDYVQFSAQYRGNYVTPVSKWAFGVGSNFGMRGLGNDEQEFANKRDLAKPNYIYFSAFGNYTRKLYQGSQLYLALDGQVADTPLVSNEQFNAGGAQSVRGYYESQALGDNGLVTNIELRSPSYAEHIPQISELRLLAFADAAKLHVRHPLSSNPDTHELYSAGLGFRLTGDKGFDAEFDWAWPLKDNSGVDEGDGRAHFKLHYGF